LQELRRNPRTSLQEHAVKVKQLAQIAQGNLSPGKRERYTFNAFVKSLTNLRLYHQLLATGPQTVEDTIREGKAYLLAAKLHKSHAGFH